MQSMVGPLRLRMVVDSRNPILSESNMFKRNIPFISISFCFGSALAVWAVEPDKGWADGQPFVLSDCFYYGETSSGPRYLDAWVNDNRIHFSYGGRFYGMQSGFDPSRNPLEGLAAMDVEDGGSIQHYDLKLRWGTFYKRTERGVFERDSKTGRWRQILRTGKSFSQFEVLSNGDILLLCAGTPDPSFPLRPGRDMTFQRHLADTFSFIEIYKCGEARDRPSFAMGLPPELSGLCRMVEDLPVFDRTIPFNDQILLLNTHLGLVYLFDGKSKELVRIETPWISMTESFLREGMKWLSTRDPRSRTILSSASFPYSITFYPQDSLKAILLVSLNDSFRPGQSRKMDLDARKRGNRFMPVSREFSDDEVARGESFQLYELDLPHRRIRPFQGQKPVSSILSVSPSSLWIDPGGKGVDLRFLTPATGSPAPN